MKVFSATQFFNELDLLELRLETLDPVVDYFIISESTKTHSGLNKPLYYKENKDRYKKFHDKIIHQIVGTTPDNFEEVLEQQEYAKALNSQISVSIYDNIIKADWFDKNVSSYIRDTYEKEALLYMLHAYCQPKDMVLLGDLDEIPRPEKVEFLKTIFNPEKVYHFKNDMFYYYLNLEKKNELWRGTLATSFEHLLTTSFCRLRTEKPGYTIYDGGWHFTYMGGPEKVKTKVQSWGEQSLNVKRVRDNIESNITHCIEKKQDLFFRPANFVVKDIDDGTFPQYLVDNKDKFSHMIYK